MASVSSPQASLDLFQSEVKCEAIDLKMIFYSHEKPVKTYSHKKGIALNIWIKTTFPGGFFIKSLKEGRLVRAKHRETQVKSPAFVCAVLLLMALFLPWIKQRDLDVVILLKIDKKFQLLHLASFWKWQFLDEMAY